MVCEEEVVRWSKHIRAFFSYPTFNIWYRFGWGLGRDQTRISKVKFTPNGSSTASKTPSLMGFRGAHPIIEQEDTKLA